MAAFSELYQYINTEVGNCPNVIINRAIVDAVRELCRRSGILTKTDTIVIVPGQKQYTITPPPGMDVLSIRNVKIGTDYLLIYQSSSPDIEIDEAQAGASISYYKWQPQNTIKFYPTPTVAPNETVRITYVYQPIKTATTIPDELAQRWPEAIGTKVKSLLMRQAGKPWSNPQYAVMYEREWWRILGDIRAEANLMYNQTPQTAMYTLDTVTS